MTQLGGDAGMQLPSLRRMRGGVLRVVIVCAAIALTGVTWGFTLISIETEEREARVHAAGNVSNLARTLQWELERQLQTIDQTMQILAVEWRNDPVRFDPTAWKKRSSLLGDVSLQLSILDAQGFVVSSTRPDLLGTDNADRDYFQAQRASRRAGLFVGPAIRWKATGRWEINLSRRLERDDGGFAGAIVVGYDPWALTTLLEQVDLGPRGLIALLGSDGAIRALVSPYQLAPGEDVSTSEMFRQSVQRQQGTWTGQSAPDGVTRMHAFRRLAGQDLTIVVGTDQAEAMRTATTWAENARYFAAGISVMVVLMAALLMREVSAARGREERLAQDRAVIEDAYSALEVAKASGDAKTSQLEATMSGMSDGVMMLDENLCLVQWNERFAQYAGVPRDVLRVGQPFEDLLRAQARAGEFGPVDVEAEVRRRLIALRGHRSVGVSERARPDGRTLELRRSALPGGGFVTLYTDITARKQAEDAQAAARRLAEEAAEQKSRFVAIVSHEIRTPLNAVVNSLSLLDSSGMSPTQHRLAGTARQAGYALLDLVNDILELSEMDAGRPALRPTVFELRPVLEGVQDMFRTQAEARGITLALEIAPDVPERIHADGGRIRQVLMNFVSNATKFSNPGTLTIRTAIAADQAGRPALSLCVEDQGPRIPDREAGQLFQPFSRLDNARSSGVPGTGLGLAICERLTRLMDGAIGVRAAEGGAGQGNVFWVTLPLHELPGAPEHEGVAMPQRQRRASVLIVEDIPANHLVTATLLRRDGHRVDVAESGQEAIELVRAHPYELVFMDLIMPGMNGFEATRRIRALAGPESGVLIVALTATTAPEDRARCLEAGMDDMIGKPVRAAELADVIKRTLLPSKRPLAARPTRSTVPRAVAPASAAPGTAGALVPAIDRERMVDLRRGLPPGTLASLIEQCLADMRRRVAPLRQALVAAHAPGIEESAHALAGMAATYGFVAVEGRMRRVMAAARRHDMIAAMEAAEDLETELARVAQAARLELQRTQVAA